jgi:hypothetical protein
MNMGTEALRQPERRIVERLVNRAAESNYLVSVWDGEEYAIKFESDPQKVMREMASTDMDKLIIRDKEKQRIGTVFLVYGNGEDVVSDYSWSAKYPQSEQLMETLTAPEQEEDADLIDKADQKHMAQMLDGCEDEDEHNTTLRNLTQ